MKHLLAIIGAVFLSAACTSSTDNPGDDVDDTNGKADGWVYPEGTYVMSGATGTDQLSSVTLHSGTFSRQFAHGEDAGEYKFTHYLALRHYIRFYDEAGETDRYEYVLEGTKLKLRLDSSTVWFTMTYQREPAQSAILKAYAELGDVYQNLYADAFSAGSVITTSSDPIEMLKQYVADTYPADHGTFQYLTSASAFPAEGRTLGILPYQVVFNTMNTDLLLLKDLTNDIASVKTAADAALVKLKSADAIFGFDGLAKNGCSVGTHMLLVLDPGAKAVYFLDLSPCLE